MSDGCLFCSCQFVVSDRGEYGVHTSDPDLLVDWDSIELVVSPSPPLSLCVFNVLTISAATVLPRDSILPNLPLPSQSRYQTLEPLMYYSLGPLCSKDNSMWSCVLLVLCPPLPLSGETCQQRAHCLLLHTTVCVCRGTRSGESVLYATSQFTRKISRGIYSQVLALLLNKLSPSLSVMALSTPQYSPGDVISMRLMVREKNSTLVRPRSQATPSPSSHSLSPLSG